MVAAGRKIYRVRLSDEERQALQEIQRGKGAAQRRLRAHLLLLADEDRKGGGYRIEVVVAVTEEGSIPLNRLVLEEPDDFAVL